MRALVISLFSLFVVALASCDQPKPAPTLSAASAVGQAATATKIAKVAFIDKQEVCDCTRKRIDDTWAALQAALGAPAKLPVERIHIDTQGARAETYTTLKPLMVPPGVYFVDEHDAVVEMLQGEVTAQQIAAVLKTSLTAP